MATLRKIIIFFLFLGIFSYLADTRGAGPYIDTHIHLIERHKLKFPPVADNIPQENFSPSRFEADSYSTPVRYAVVVQASEEAEVELDYAIKESCCRESLVGVVAGISLRDPNFEEKILRKYSNGRGKRMLVGIRNALEQLHDEEFYNHQAMGPALSFMQERGLVLDLLASPHDLQRLTVIPETFPNLKIVINHMGMPFNDPQLEREWRDGMTNIAQYPNVYVKISGLMNEDLINRLFQKGGHQSNPKPTYSQFRPKVEHSINVFGVDRILYASNWPVDLMGLSNYSEIYKFIDGIVPLHEVDKDKLFRTNAIKVYGLTLDYPTCGGVSSFDNGSLRLSYLTLFSLIYWCWMRSE